MAARPLSALLVGSAHDVKEHLRPVAAAVVTEDVATSVKSLLQCLSGTGHQLRGACSAWGIPAKKDGKHLAPDALKEALLEKLLALLPPVSFGSLLEHVQQEDVHGSLADYKDALVAATDAKRVLELLMVLGPVQRGGKTDFRRICYAWKVQVQQGRRDRPRAELQAELRGACIRFLKEASGSSAVSPAMEASARSAVSAVLESANSAVAAGASSADSPGQASGNGQDPQNLTDAHAAVCASGPAVRTRVAGKRHAVAFVPKDLEYVIEKLHKNQNLSKKEQLPWMTLAGCKPRRRFDGKEVHPSNAMTLWETERAAVEKLRVHLRLDPECRAGYRGPEFTTPRTLEEFGLQLQSEELRAATPFGNDFRRVHLPLQWDGQHVLRRLALMEADCASADSRCPFPLLDGPLVEAIRVGRGHVADGEKITSFDDLLDTLERSRLGMPDQAAWFQGAWHVKERLHLQNIFDEIDIFLQSMIYIRDLWTTTSRGTLMVWMAWFAILKRTGSRKKQIPEVVTESRTVLKVPKGHYVEAQRLNNTYVSPPHFKQDSLCMSGVAEPSYGPSTAADRDALPILTAPRMCELCGDGFACWNGLVKHVEAKHVNWAEYRKRVFWHAQYEDAWPSYGLPLSWRRKRRILGNATTRLVSSKSWEPRDPEAEDTGVRRVTDRPPRQMLGCATCATKCWSERMRKCYMFRTLKPGEAVAVQENDPEVPEGDDGVSSGEDGHKDRGTLLADKNGILYFGPPEVIDSFLSVNKYIEKWPLIPVAELHASSVQHPEHPEWRWLLHTRRVPVLAVSQQEELAVSQQETLPKSAGIGDPDSTVLLRRWCAKNLCHRKPTLPQRALANDLWGGRELVPYQKLRSLPATKMLLGQGRVLYRKVVLNKKHGREAVDLQHGLQGNTTFVAQPKTSEIQKVLPPPMDVVGETLQVIFSVSRQDVAKAAPLQVPRNLYLECAKLRQERCPLYRDVMVDEQRAQEMLREDEAPPELVAAAVQMDEANLFRPNLTGPAGAWLFIF